ncbi:unnamed protein product [Effrenium voratum]|uniref:RRM domain-containing protein n=1 Tax=Effrenium voratum TaxID=2562239 RepID=A0AA36HLH0_9DINO|nr:unnamed protein product [Effrenium voratum]CAJ1435794.1 unnamed protein product [Effrenium voratum]
MDCWLDLDSDGEIEDPPANSAGQAPDASTKQEPHSPVAASNAHEASPNETPEGELEHKVDVAKSEADAEESEASPKETPEGKLHHKEADAEESEAEAANSEADVAKSEADVAKGEADAEESEASPKETPEGKLDHNEADAEDSEAEAAKSEVVAKSEADAEESEDAKPASETEVTEHTVSSHARGERKRRRRRSGRDWKTLEAWKAEGVDIDGRSGLRRQRGGGLAARTEKSGSPLARGQRKRRRLSQPEEAREKEAKGLREVYVGGLCWSAARKEVIIRAFDSAFQELPEYRARYAGLSNPIVNVHFPQDQGARSTPSVRPSFASTFAFVEFVDTILARTALELSGLQIGGRSARICQASAGMQPEGQFLDVEPLRQQAKIPHTGGPGSQMLLTVWIGSFPQRIVRDEMQRKAAADAEQKPISDDRESFAFQLGAAALQLPGVRQRYPELRRPVLTMRFSECNRFAFTDFSTELLASSVVAAGQLSLENGMKIRTGWPVGATNAEERAPPPLAEDGSICAKPQAFVASVGAIHEEDLIERMDCEVFLGGVQGLEVQDLWSGLTKLLSGLQSYNAEFGHLSLPIVNMRLGTGPFAFARMADPRLASTAIALGEMVVNRRMVHLRRPSSFHDKPAAPLDLNPKTSTLPLPPPPKLLTTAPDPVEKENPPAPPAVPPPTHSIWVGNLPGKADLCGSDDEDTSNQELLVQRLDQRLVELAMKLPSYDFEDGPPIKRISMHHSLSFAFVEIVGSQERVEELMSAFDNKDFMGKSLEVNWSRRRKDCLFMRQFPRRSSTTWVADVPKGILQLLPDMAKRIEGYAKSECAMQIDQL